MPKVVGYHRPSTVDEAVGLLSQPGSAVLAGGTLLNADRRGEPVVAVDLQALGLDVIEPAEPPRLIIAVVITTVGRCAVARTARTPGDEPIVSAYARSAGDGSVRLALSGVAATPLLVDDTAALSPPGDFRGSSEYR